MEFSRVLFRSSKAARPLPVRTQLEELTRRSSAGTVPPLEGPHRFDPDAARDYRPAAVLALFAPTLSDSTQAADPGADVFLVQRSRHLRSEERRVGKEVQAQLTTHEQPIA